MTKKYKVISIEDFGVVVDMLNVTQYPQTVVEKLTTGEWMLWQIDNANDIDKNNQMNIVGTVGKRLGGIPLIELVDNIKYIALKHIQDTIGITPSDEGWDEVAITFKNMFIAGYEANANKYSEEDIHGLLKFAYDNPMSGDFETVTKTYIQSLQKQPIPTEVELGMEPQDRFSYASVNDFSTYKPIITNKTNNTITAVNYK